MRWVAVDVPPVQAGTLARIGVELENAGGAPWRGLNLSYHWLDERGNPIVWDGIRTPVEAAPGELLRVDAPVRGPIPPGSYRLALDLVDEERFWLVELGNHTPTVDVDVEPRDATAARAFVPNGLELAPDWEERVYVAHTEGYAAVRGSIAYEGGRPIRAGGPSRTTARAAPGSPGRADSPSGLSRPPCDASRCPAS